MNRPTKIVRRAAAASIGLAGAVSLLRSRRSRSRADPDGVGYPPLATAKQIDSNLWIVDDTIVASGLHLPIRMTVIRLLSGDLVIHSPTHLNPILAENLDALGSVAHVVAPTTAHWIHLAEWQRAYPGAKTWAVPGLRDRRQVRKAGVRIDEDLGDRALAEWSAEIDHGIVAGGFGFAEAYFYHRITRTVILCDLVQNLDPDRLLPIARCAAKIARGTSETTANHVRAVLRLGGDAPREALRALVTLQPDRVIFAHGEIFETDATARLRKSFAWITGDNGDLGASSQ